ncbi:MAG TPA: hypothetical protein VF844_00840 [Ktedonobacteraceae bacterium]
MSSLSKQEQLCQLIDEQQERIRQTFPAHRGSAVVALTSARDWHYLKLQDTLNAATKTATAHNSERGPRCYGWLMRCPLVLKMLIQFSRYTTN